MIGVLGAGAFGTALAVVHGISGKQVVLWGRDSAAMAEMCRTRQNHRLAGVEIPQSVTVTADMQRLADCEILLLAMQMQALRGFVVEHSGFLNGRTLVACCKGIDLATLQGPTGIIRAACTEAVPMVLSGPSFASDIAQGLSTALTLACYDNAAGAMAQQILSTPTLRIYLNTDVTGTELGGALKNVIAIACGACMGAGMGESARAALMTRGFAEMQRLAVRLGGRPETLMGLSGFGDLVLTCTSGQSRNFGFGLALGRGEVFDKTLTVEGVATAYATVRLALRLGIEMPITNALVEVLNGTNNVTKAIEGLLSRPLKQE